MTDKVLTYTTCSDVRTAEKLATHLLQNRIAACINVLPGVKSFYRWQGKVETDAEVLLMIKTSRDLITEVRRVIEKLHDYDLPELIVVPIVGGSPDYLAWLERELITTK
ncbi:MAG: divalent-cation tolerance protein CutA [Solibacterales bacterium]|nr:divalent-cation tolerance protein CutA [Bryobacterales bacterium]|tara:strand:+ start:5548 stop:5874 length:327 start_codon:yes stop_codon:yes gene_type:complete